VLPAPVASKQVLADARCLNGKFQTCLERAFGKLPEALQGLTLTYNPSAQNITNIDNNWGIDIPIYFF
jgi:hypothetical protein